MLNGLGASGASFWGAAWAGRGRPAHRAALAMAPVPRVWRKRRRSSKSSRGVISEGAMSGGRRISMVWLVVWVSIGRAASPILTGIGLKRLSGIQLLVDGVGDGQQLLPWQIAGERIAQGSVHPVEHRDAVLAGKTEGG